MPVGWVCEWCMMQWAPSWNSCQRGEPWVGKGARMWAEVPGGQTSLTSTWGNHACACACELELCCVCAALVTSCLCQPKRRRLGCLCMCLFMWVVYIGAVKGRALSAAVSVTSHVSVLLVCLEYVWSFATGCTRKQKSSSHIPQPEQRTQVLRQGSSTQAGGKPGPEWLEEADTFLTSLN